MFRAALLTASLALGLASTAHAAVPAPMPLLPDGIIAVSGGCGPGGFRDAYGACRPIRPVYRPRFCPPGYHLGAYGGRCWPNR